MSAYRQNGMVCRSSRREVANEKTRQYLIFYQTEKSLAIGYLFVWLTLFGYFAIPLDVQKRVPVLGVLDSIFMRTVLIFALVDRDAA